MAVATLVQSAPPAVGLDVLISAEGTTTVLALRGEADIATLPVVVDALARVIADQVGDVVVDLADVDFMDTAALRAVLRAREELYGGERQLTLRSPSRIAGRLLAVFGLSQLVGPAPGAETDDQFAIEVATERKGQADEPARNGVDLLPDRPRGRVGLEGGKGPAMTMEGRVWVRSTG